MIFMIYCFLFAFLSNSIVNSKSYAYTQVGIQSNHIFIFYFYLFDEKQNEHFDPESEV